MTDEEGSLNRTAVGISVLSTQEFHVLIVVVVINSAVKRQQNHLWNLKAYEKNCISKNVPQRCEKRYGDIHNDVDNFSHAFLVCGAMIFMIYHGIYTLSGRKKGTMREKSWEILIKRKRHLL
jgi:hypothetical protein